MSVIQSHPYPWPYHGELQPPRTAIVLFSDGPIPANGRPLRALAQLVEAARAADIRVVHSLHAGEQPLLPVLSADLVTERPGYGAFTGTDFDLVLRRAGVSDLLIAGMPVELGADCTMREANDLGYECLLVEDCCTGLSDETFHGTVSSAQMSGGIFGAVATVEEVIACLRDSKE